MPTVVWRRQKVLFPMPVVTSDIISARLSDDFDVLIEWMSDRDSITELGRGMP